MAMINDCQKKILAILFASGEPLEMIRLASVLDLNIQQLEQQLEQLSETILTQGYPFQILKLADRLQMTTCAEYAEIIRQVLEMKRNTTLSNAAMETLAIIAYNQPVTKGFVEQVRGVDSVGIVNSLVEKGLIEEAGRLDIPGKPLSYGTTANFLRCFGLSSLEQLPQIVNAE